MVAPRRRSTVVRRARVRVVAHGWSAAAAVVVARACVLPATSVCRARLRLHVRRLVRYRAATHRARRGRGADLCRADLTDATIACFTGVLRTGLARARATILRTARAGLWRDAITIAAPTWREDTGKKCEDQHQGQRDAEYKRPLATSHAPILAPTLFKDCDDVLATDQAHHLVLARTHTECRHADILCRAPPLSRCLRPCRLHRAGGGVEPGV